MDVLLDALGHQARQPHQEDVSTSSTDALQGVTSGWPFCCQCPLILRLSVVLGVSLAVGGFRGLHPVGWPVPRVTLKRMLVLPRA
jgi:hypothetical protein